MSKTNRREFIAQSSAWMAAASLAPGWLGNTAGRKNGTPPNVIYIMTDQQRANTLRVSGNTQVQTPNLDRLAGQGVLFSSCYSSQPVCSPCRSSMVTGLFPHSTGVIDNSIPLNANLFAWPRAFRQAGYKTAYIGKWHLGWPPPANEFDVLHGYDTGWPHWIDGTNPPVYRPDEETDFAMNFIEQNKDIPFLCWLSFYPPHTPLTAPQEDIDLYQDKIAEPVYHAMVHRIDWNVGRLLDKVEQLGLRNNTIIIFTSDHGENFPQRWNNHLKRLCYDSAANVPLIFSWPGALPEGEVRPHIISMVDVPVTILDLGNLAWPDHLHGESAKRLLHGDVTSWHDTIFIENRPYVSGDMVERCVVTEEWKLIYNSSRPPELYDRTTDRSDLNNIYGNPANAGVVADLTQRLIDWAKRTGDTVTPSLLASMSGFHVY